MLDKSLAILQWMLIVSGVAGITAGLSGFVSMDLMDFVILASMAAIAIGGIPVPIWRIARMTR